MGEKVKSLVGIVGNDLKNFKTISTKRKVIYIAVAVVLIFLVYCTISSSGESNNSETNSQTSNDTLLISKAFSKWISTNEEANALYNNNNCLWDGSIVGSNGNIVFVNLHLYDRNYYNQLKSMGKDTSAAQLLSGTVRMSKDEL